MSLLAWLKSGSWHTFKNQVSTAAQQQVLSLKGAGTSSCATEGPWYYESGVLWVFAALMLLGKPVSTCLSTEWLLVFLKSVN